MEMIIEELDDISLKKMISFVHSAIGITLPEHKRTMIQRRLLPRLKENAISHYSDYLKLIQNDKEELIQFINMMTTNETNFFRTSRIWDYFENTFLEEFVESCPDRKINIWSAAASTGEEGYSLAMSCSEFNQTHSHSLDYHILGTDISRNVIEHANLGVYDGRNVENLRNKNAVRLDKYFSLKSGKHLISNKLKEKVIFKVHNLFDELNSPLQFDIIFLRNVLIYFSVKDQEHVLKNIEKRLNQNGILVIGESESLSSLDTNFKFISPLIYKKIA